MSFERIFQSTSCLNSRSRMKAGEWLVFPASSSSLRNAFVEVNTPFGACLQCFDTLFLAFFQVAEEGSLTKTPHNDLPTAPHPPIPSHRKHFHHVRWQLDIDGAPMIESAGLKGKTKQQIYGRQERRYSQMQGYSNELGYEFDRLPVPVKWYRTRGPRCRTRRRSKRRTS